MVSYRLLEPLSEEVRRELLASARRRRFGRGEVVFHDGDPGDTLHLVAKGHFAVRVTTPLGDTAMLRVFRPGECFGELSLLHPGPRTGTVVALDDADTLTLHHDQFAELRGRHPDVDGIIIDSLTAEVRRLARALVEAMYVPVDQRVWQRLVELADIYGDAADGASAAVIPLTQEDLAQLAGTTRPTVNRLLRSAESEGHVRMARARLEVLDVDALRTRARRG